LANLQFNPVSTALQKALKIFASDAYYAANLHYWKFSVSDRLIDPSLVRAQQMRGISHAISRSGAEERVLDNGHRLGHDP
jgi:hypothetical protein